MKNFEKHGRAGDAGPRQAIIYCRVASTALADKDMALLSQEIRCRAYAAEKGYPVATVLHDCPASGARFDRAGIRHLFQYLARENAPGRYVVLVDDVTRIGRSVDAYREFQQALGAAGAKLECRDAGIGPELNKQRTQNERTFTRSGGPKR